MSIFHASFQKARSGMLTNVCEIEKVVELTDEEYETIKTVSKTQRGAYAFVKSWFLTKYKDEFDRRKKELEDKRREAKENHLLYTPATAN